MERYQSSFQLSKSVHDFNTQIEASYQLAKSFENKSEFVAAEKWYLTATELIEKISFPLSLNQEIQIAQFSGVNEVYNSFTTFYLRHGKAEDAFKLIEKSRSRNTKTNLEKSGMMPVILAHEARAVQDMRQDHLFLSIGVVLLVWLPFVTERLKDRRRKK